MRHPFFRRLWIILPITVLLLLFTVVVVAEESNDDSIDINSSNQEDLQPSNEFPYDNKIAPMKVSVGSSNNSPRRQSNRQSKNSVLSVVLMLALFGNNLRSQGQRSLVAAFSVAHTALPKSAFAAESSPSRQLHVRGGARRPIPNSINGISIGQKGSTVMSSTAAPEAAAGTGATQEFLQTQFDTVHPSYDVVSKDLVTEYGAYCTLYRHKKSGAELLSVSVDDDNKVFGITLRTPPEDSTGVPHILEHSVLCGSRKYKTKDPFVQLLKGSLQTFLNAFTYPDRTCYVVASQNLKDFYNLVNVYADAVYHPRAVSDPMVHAQEGWHLEMDEDGENLIYNGVVYNEMKGVYSSADSLLNRASQRSLFLDNTYAVDSGGDPRNIPDLSFEQFKGFHEKHYHPSNSRIYFAGDDNVMERLQLMDEYLNEFDDSPEYRETSKIVWQKKSFTEPVKEVETYPAGKDQPAKHMFNVNWLLNDRPLTAFEELTLGVLDHLLLGTTSSILRKSLLESELGEAVTGGGLSDELLQATFSIGLKGVQKEDVAKAEQLIYDTMDKAAKEGFAADAIASSLNTIEFQLREFNTGSFPKYLSFMLGANSKWLYEESPTSGLKFEEPLAQLKESIAKDGSKIFQDMITDFIVNNKHRSTVELTPSKTMEDEIIKEEKDRLSKIKAGLSQEALDEILAKTAALKELQGSEDTAEDRATIPGLELSDLTNVQAEYPIAVSENENDSGITVVRHEMGSTSGIAYVSLGVDLSTLSLDDVPLLPLFTRLMTEAGAGEYDSVSFSRRIGTHTGGASVGLLTTAVHPTGSEEGVAVNGEQMQTKLVLKGKATSEKIDELFDIFKLMLTEANLDSKNKVIEVLKETRSRMESTVQGAGHSIANSRMKAKYRVGGYVDELTGGISYLDAVKVLVVEAEKDWPSVLARLENMRSTILKSSICRSGMMLDIVGEKAVLDNIQPSVEQLLNDLPGESDGEKFPDFYETPHPWVPEATKRMAILAENKDEGFVVPTQVSYVGKSGLLYDNGEYIPGSASVVARFLRTGYLWDHVRVMGGAYGGFCVFSSFSGMVSFLSYRDPNLDKTLDVYDGAADALDAAADAMEKNPDILTTAIIGAVGDLDGALTPDQKGYTAFNRWLINESAEHRQKHRNEVLNTKPSDFRDFAERLRNMKDPSVAVVSSKGSFEAAAKAGKEMKLVEVL